MWYGMTYEAVMVAVMALGYVVLEDTDHEEDGEVWIEMDLEMDSEVGLSLVFEGGVVTDVQRFAMCEYWDAH